MIWPHLPFFGCMMTRRSLNLDGETSSLDSNDPKPMMKRGSIVTMNTLANLRNCPCLAINRKAGNAMQQSVKQRHSRTYLRVARFIFHLQHVDLRSERQHKPSPSRLSIVGQGLAKNVLWSLEHRHESTISHTSSFEKHKRQGLKGEKGKKSASTNNVHEVVNRALSTCRPARDCPKLRTSHPHGL